MKVNEIHQMKQVKFKLKNVHSKYKINAAPTYPKLPALFVFCASWITQTFLSVPPNILRHIQESENTGREAGCVWRCNTRPYRSEQYSERSAKGLGQVWRQSFESESAQQVRNATQTYILESRTDAVNHMSIKHRHISLTSIICLRLTVCLLH